MCFWPLMFLSVPPRILNPFEFISFVVPPDAFSSLFKFGQRVLKFSKLPSDGPPPLVYPFLFISIKTQFADEQTHLNRRNAGEKPM